MNQPNVSLERMQPSQTVVSLTTNTARQQTRHENSGTAISKADQDMLDGLLQGATSILSDDPDICKVPDVLQEGLLLLDNGCLLVTENVQGTAELPSFIKLIERSSSISVTKKQYIPSTGIHYIRQKLGTFEDDETAASAVETVEAEKLFYELIKVTADHGASDIHYSVYGRKVSVEVRNNGRKRPVVVKALKAERAKQFMAAVYGMSDSKGEFNPRRHQEGNVRIEKIKDPQLREALKGYVSARLNFLPVIGNGIHMVIRLNGKHKRINSFTEIGFSERQATQLDRITTNPGGYVVIGGPVNSGKSRTLAALVQRRGDRNINENGARETSQLSLEDPPELFVDGLLPLDVMAEEDGEDASDKKLHETMRGLNRSDYDDAILGEVRDGVMAQRVLEIAMSGRFVASTVHATNGIMVFSRLEQLLQRYRGLGASFEDLYEQANIAAVMSQRLLPRVCPHCARTLNQIENDELRLNITSRLLRVITFDPNVKLLFRGPGCKHCDEGYSGRELVAEIIRPEQKFLELLKKKQTHEAREYWMNSLNGEPMILQAYQKMTDGLIDPTDVERTFGYFDEISNPRPAHNDTGDGL